jgi:hypothetical protein
MKMRQSLAFLVVWGAAAACALLALLAPESPDAAPKSEGLGAHILSLSRTGL